VFTEEATLHHFRCSYVGRKSEFQQNEVLRCPKCERRLRHVGVDYDKPRRDFWCGDCGRQFEEPEVECHCLNCRETCPPEDAEIRTFREYEITPDGRLSAQEGSYPETHVADLLRNTPGLYRPRAFEQLYRLEVARCQRYDVPATLASLRIENLTELVNGRAGRKLRRLTDEIKELLGGTFRETDLLTDVSRDHILVIFTHTPAEEARNALERLDDSLRELVAHRIEVESTVFDLREGAPDLEEVKKRSA
jgi:GGDEF domain-containing protein